jgi:hypothetical protein
MGVGASLGVVGVLIGFAVGHLPPALKWVTAKISRNRRLLSTLFALCGYLVLIGLSLAFCLSLWFSSART